MRLSVIADIRRFEPDTTGFYRIVLTGV